MTVSDEGKRSFYEKEAVNSGWSVRELKRQIESSLYERLLLSSADAKDIFLKKLSAVTFRGHLSVILSAKKQRK